MQARRHGVEGMILAIDPSSTVLGAAIMDNEALIHYGIIDTTKELYEKRYMFIIEKLNEVIKKYPVEEIACEKVVRFVGKRIPSLEVAVKAIEHWAKRRKLTISFYSPGEWKAGVVGNGHATKEEVARVIHLLYPGLRDNLPDHITDAIGIGLFHIGLMKIKGMVKE